MTGPCMAKLVHWHGVSECRDDVGHEGQHHGVCWSCAEDDDDWTHLCWDEDSEDWTKRGR
jgi:hypothetical protein